MTQTIYVSLPPSTPKPKRRERRGLGWGSEREIQLPLFDATPVPMPKRGRLEGTPPAPKGDRRWLLTFVDLPWEVINATPAIVRRKRRAG